MAQSPTPAHMRTHYDSLKVTEDAPPEVIRAAYRALCLKYHPDRCGDSRQSQRMMQTLNEAWAVLSDENKRADYDGELHRLRNPAMRPPVDHVHTAPMAHRQVRFRRPRPAWLKAVFFFLSDARVVLPVVAIIWWVIFRLISHF